MLEVVRLIVNKRTDSSGNVLERKRETSKTKGLF